MSVAEHLGLSTPESNELIRQARERWPGWVVADPCLGVVADPLDVKRWTLAAEPDCADEVLLALAKRAARDGGDDRAAAMTLCWALLPGAASVDRWHHGLMYRTDQLVASQLWLEARSFPWQRLRKVAGNIRGNVRSAVLLQGGRRPKRAASDHAWDLTGLAEPADMVELAAADLSDGLPEPTSWEEMLEVLEWGCRQDVITTADRALLLSLVEAAERADVSRVRVKYGGLTGIGLSEAVADRWGVSAVTIRRRARRSVQALAEAVRHGGYEACA